MLEKIVETVLPTLITAIEMMGVVIITVGTFKAFCLYVYDLFTKKNKPVKSILAHAMAMGLEFKMAAEILKTVMVKDLRELLFVACIIGVRALLSVLIHYDMKQDRMELTDKNQ